MNDEELLEHLRKVVREEDPLHDPALIALLDGKATDEQRAAVEELARSSPDVRTILDVGRPLAEDARERMLKQVVLPVRLTPPPPPPSSWQKYAAGAGALAMLVLSLPIYSYYQSHRPLSAQWREREYDGDKSTRGGTEPKEETLRLSPGSQLKARFHSEQAVEDAIEARGYLVKDGEARAWDVPIELANGGADARIIGSREKLFPGIPAGHWEMVVAFGRKGCLPSASEISALSRDRYRDEGKPYRLYPKGIDLVESPPP